MKRITIPMATLKDVNTNASKRETRIVLIVEKIEKGLRDELEKLIATSDDVAVEVELGTLQGGLFDDEDEGEEGE